MSKKILILLLPLTLLFSCSEEEIISIDENAVLEDDGGPVMVDQQSPEQQILKLVNEHRKNLGLSSLARNKTADNLSIDHCNYMISKNDISHDNFSKRAGILQDQENAKSVGENVAAGQPDAKSVMNDWLNSTGHKENIEGNFTHIGIAAVKDSNNRYYYTQLFFRK